MTTNRSRPSPRCSASLAAGALLTLSSAAYAQGAPTPASAPEKPPASTPPPVPPTGPVLVQDPADTPPPARALFGSQQKYTPPLHIEPWGIKAQASFLLGVHVDRTTAFPVDRDLHSFDPGGILTPVVRANLAVDTSVVRNTILLHAEYEHDILTGYAQAAAPIAGSEMPGSQPIDQQLRKAYLRVSIGPNLHFGGGFMMNHFGLGLLANDGVQSSWTPGSARFADSRGGDRVLRGFLATGPLTDAGLTASFAVDKVQGDDVLLNGDEAWQLVGTMSVGAGKPWGAGIFVVQRQQDNAGGTRTNATVVDLTARYAGVLPWVSYSLEGEAAFVNGETTLGPTTEHPRHKVRQAAAAARFSVRRSYVGGVVDFLYASGDGNADDGSTTAFKADPNYEMGLLLFKQVIAAQTGRGAVTAANPDLVGVPAPGLERVPTRGSVTNTVSLFPRIYVRPTAGVEAYGGPLFAWAATPLLDPLNTRLGGGVPHNALDGKGGNFMGVELDVGARYRMLLWGTELTVGFEGGVLLPGDAFNDAQGNAMGPVGGLRVLAGYRL